MTTLPSTRPLAEYRQALTCCLLESDSRYDTVAITGATSDSRAVKPGHLFCAIRGAKLDGHDFIPQALAAGAAALILERPVPGLPVGQPQLLVRDAYHAAALAAEVAAGRPAQDLRLAAITGTNGKTTTTFMIRDILQAAGQSCGLLGTVQYEYGGRRLAAGRTTPEALDLQRMLAEALHAGCQAVAMEVSSQGLAAERLRGVRFAAAVFTNLSVDHLDFHHTMEAYFLAKKRLFDTIAAQGGAPAVINADDPHGRQLAADPALAGHVVTFGGDPAAQVRAVDIQLTETSSTFRVITPWGEAAIATGFAGRFNVYNALAAIATCGTLGVPLPVMAATLAAMPAVPGRMERIADPHGRHIFVDYAHTEDARRPPDDGGQLLDGV
ncbi:MAG TPA: UDP-N-acetylmuramyl-tripeptide synthetase, partial [Lentisphaeria bacterium]|nr:UDP-N-acetylmuramyl-tripeptide synthetase [Lentisphaeria bacterium]